MCMSMCTWYSVQLYMYMCMYMYMYMCMYAADVTLPRYGPQI